MTVKITVEILDTDKVINARIYKIKDGSNMNKRAEALDAIDDFIIECEREIKQ